MDRNGWKDAINKKKFYKIYMEIMLFKKIVEKEDFLKKKALNPSIIK